MNRGMQFIKTPIVIFSDGNTMLGKESVQRIVDMFKDPKVGCVSGEKEFLVKILMQQLEAKEYIGNMNQNLKNGMLNYIQ